MIGFEKLKRAAKAVRSLIQEELPRTKKLVTKAVTSTSEFRKDAGTALNEKYKQVIEATYKVATSEDAQEFYSKTKEVAQEARSMAARGISLTAEKAGNLFRSAVTQENIRKAIDTSKEIVLDGKNLIALWKEDIEQEDGSSEEEKIKRAILKLQKKDKVGLAGDAMSILGGAAAGSAAAGTIASAAGATTILGSTTLGSLLGGTFVAATPVGWVIGSAAAAAAAGFGIGRLIRSGSTQDQVRSEIVERLTKRLSRTANDKKKSEHLEKIKRLLPVAIEHHLISESQADRMIDLITTDRLDPELALNRLKSMRISIEISQL
jgi:hypothetical protein